MSLQSRFRLLLSTGICPKIWKILRNSVSQGVFVGLAERRKGGKEGETVDVLDEAPGNLILWWNQEQTTLCNCSNRFINTLTWSDL